MNHADNANPTDLTTPRRAMLAGLGGLAAGAFLAGGRTAHAGPLNPPAGPISPTPGPEPRIPINPTNTPGNSGSTFIISEPGSYYITQNYIGRANRHLITVAADNVTIDLMGYTLEGVSDSLSAIHHEGQRHGVTVRNGHIRGWGTHGVDLVACQAAVVEHIAAHDNDSVGIRVGSDSLVHLCTASSNGGTGISLGTSCLATRCISTDNSAFGIITQTRSRISDCIAQGNQSNGFFIAAGGSITNCTASGNTGTGILTASLASRVFIIEGCTCVNNGSDGIHANINASIRHCHCYQNTGAGIRASGSDSQIDGNTCYSNGIGITVESPLCIVTRNVCANNSNNWSVSSENACLVVSASLSGNISGNSGGSSYGTSNPLANLTLVSPF